MAPETIHEDKEARRQAILKEMAELKAKGIGNSSDNESRFQRMKKLDNDLLEIDPLPK